MGWKTEFPEFDPKDMPEIPPGFCDDSWWPDIGARFFNEDLGLSILIEPPVPESLSAIGYVRFSVSPIASDGMLDEEILETDDWSEVLATIEQKRRETK